MNGFDRVREICGGWGLYENSTEQTQILYAISEAGELAKSIAKNDREAAKDDIGDILVCLINAYELSNNKNKLEDQAEFLLFKQSNIELLADLLIDFSRSLLGSDNYQNMCDNLSSIADNMNLTIDECLGQAISQIEKRKGKIVNGVFCKE